MNKMRTLLCAALFAGMTVCLGGCGLNSTSYLYQNSEKYIAGDREITDRIEAVDIDYMAGEVRVTGADTAAVSISETANKEIDDARKVHTWVDGSTLYVRYCTSGKRLDLHDLGKSLVITMPADVDLKTLRIDKSSGDLAVEELKAEEAEIHTASGNVRASLEVGDCAIRSASGSVDLTCRGEAGNINIDVSSGKITADVASARYMKIHSSSGHVVARADSVTDFISETSSGDGQYYFRNTPATTDIHSSAGDVTVYLPKESDITADLHASAGHVFYDLAFSKSGDSYVCGSGQNRLDVSVSAGDVEIMDIAGQ